MSAPRYDLKINKMFCSQAEIRFRSGVLGWFNKYIKYSQDDISPDSLLKQLEHLTNFYWDVVDGIKARFKEGDLRFYIDQEGTVVRIYVFRRDDPDPVITLTKLW